MRHPIKILLQTTIPFTENDWHIGRFSLLRDYLAGLRDHDGHVMFEVAARDRDPRGKPDSVLSKLDESDFDELWLFAVDCRRWTDARGLQCDLEIPRQERRAAGHPRSHGPGVSSVCGLGGVGLAHHFHSKNPEPDPSRWRSTIPIRATSPGPTIIPAPMATIRRSGPSARSIRSCETPTRPAGSCAIFPAIRMKARSASRRRTPRRGSSQPAAAR